MIEEPTEESAFWTAPRRLLSGVLAVLLALLAQQSVAASVADPLDRPALSGPGVFHSVMLSAVTDNGRLVAVGERGIILLSDDVGETWQQAPVPVSVTLTAVIYAGPGVLWAVGHSGVILRSEDNGDHWVKLFDGRQALDLVMAEAQLKADEALLREAEWFVKDGPDKPFLGVLALDQQTVIAYGAHNMVFKTTDAGQSWASIGGDIDNPMGMHVYGLVRTANGHFVAAGEQGTLYASADQNFDLQALTSPYEGSFFGLIKDGDAVIAFGLLGNVFRSVDEGQSWQRCDSENTVSVSAMAQRPGGGLLMVTVAGQLLVAATDSCKFKSVQQQLPPLASVLAIDRYRVLLAGVGGLRVVQLPSNSAEFN